MRTPLTVIRALSEAALTDPARQPDALRQVLRSTERLTDAVEALLTRARLVAGLRELERQPFRLDQLAEEVVAETVRPPHTARVSAAPTVAYGDPTLVRIAIRNLVHNALQHGRVGDEPATIRLLIGQGILMIEDRGPGLGKDGDKEDGDKEGGGQVDSAQRFRTGAPEGVGLGLAIAAWVAELHGGTLRLGQGPGGGTVAMLGLPEAAPAKPARSPS
jgi:two-component system OmpR family sensor kinase